MTGLRRRVSVGFLSIAILLFISGLIAFFELDRLSEDSKHILSINNRKMEIADKMLEAVQGQDAAFVQMTLFADRTFDSICLRNIEELKSTLEVAKAESSDPSMLDSLTFHITEFELLVHTIIATPEFDDPTSEDNALYYDIYMPIHSDIISSIYDFTQSSFKSLEPRAEQLQSNAYRAVTPVFISLVVMIVVVLLLYYFMIIYCVNPIVRLNRSLGDFLSYRLPFTPKDDCNDEVKELQEKIESITTQMRREGK